MRYRNEDRKVGKCNSALARIDRAGDAFHSPLALQMVPTHVKACLALKATESLLFL